jgi:hypothetical protein
MPQYHSRASGNDVVKVYRPKNNNISLVFNRGLRSWRSNVWIGADKMFSFIS